MKKYLPADTSVLLHDNDPDLRPIRISLPTPPNLKEIDGYDLPVEDQRFRRIEMPARLKRLEKIALEKLEDRRAHNKNFIITLYKLQNLYWDILETEREYYADEIEFIKKIWWHRMYGYWFFNRGKPTYISGWHFVYLNFWYMPQVKGGFPEYRDRDRKEFIFHNYAYTTHETFASLADDGTAIKNIDGTYHMIQLKYRTSYGLGQPKNRRSGNTNKGLNNNLEIVTRTKGTDGMGIMSYTGSNAESHFRNKLVPAWNEYPLFFKPICISGNNPMSLVFNIADSEFRLKGLQTGATFASTSNAKFYDGQMLVGALMDEEGKCLTAGTRVLMYDGSVKKVEDIKIGDVLMGDDSAPRNVLNLGRGSGQCYMIHPKKGKPWGCNDKHILSLYSSYNANTKIGKGHIDIDMDEYFSMTPNQQKHMMLYRAPVEYAGRGVDIDPYYLGLWLGDGNKYDSAIHNIDPEVIEYIKEYANTVGGIYRLRKQGGRRIDIHAIKFNKDSKTNKKNHIIRSLDKYGVLGNKNIPRDYLINSAETRMRVLAGLIDSDGHRQNRKGNSQQYEITQKRKDLSYAIRDLCLSLGFWCSIVEKNARMKRKDGSVYECLVYRIRIYGDLYKIPCRVERKRYCPPSYHKNRRNPRHFGFSVEDIGEQDYYGVVIDGNRRFLLDDYTVVHNTTEADVDERWKTIVNTLSQGNGSIIHGYAYHPSTVEDYTSGGASYRRLMDKSDFYTRIRATGQTPSGLFRLFIPADEGLDGFIDSYGYSVKGELKDYQIKEGFTRTATEYLQGIRDHYKRLGTPEAQGDYRTQQKLFPLWYSDCWLGESGEIGFDMEIIDKRIAELNRKKQTVTGNFSWEGGVFGNNVIWTATDEGRFEVSRLFEKRANNRTSDNYFDPIDQTERHTWMPRDPTFATSGADPFKFKTNKEANQSKLYQKHRMSDGGFTVKWDYDEIVDQGKKRSEWESDRIICTYRFRPSTDDEFCEDILMACIWYGCMLYPEMNVPLVYKKFREWGYAGYLKHDISADGATIKSEPGVHMLVGTKQEGFSMARDFIKYRGHTIDHLDLLMECKNITSIDELTDYDLLASFLVCLLGSRSRYSQIVKISSEVKVDISGILNQYNY